MNIDDLPGLFEPRDIINCGGELIDLQRPVVMGILNLTPDSFYDGGKWATRNDVEQQIIKMINDGATFIDVGAMSSRPGGDLIQSKIEIERLRPYAKLFKKYAEKVVFSIDTIHGNTAEYAVQHGFRMINDICSGIYDPTTIEVASLNRLPYVAMHMKGSPTEVVKNPIYEDVTDEVMQFLIKRLEVCRQADVYDVIFDVGFGFGKTVFQNYTLLNELASFAILEVPMLVGLSRKSMIYKPLKIKPSEALNATSALHLEALKNGAKILRVHDVREAQEIIHLHSLLSNGSL